MNIFDHNVITEQSSKLKKFLFFILILLMGKGCDFFIEIDPRTNIIGTLLLVVPLILVTMREKPYYLKGSRAVVVIVLYLVWFAYHVSIDVAYPTYQGVKLLSLIIFGIITARYYGTHIGEYYEYIVAGLTLLALLLWGVELVIGPNTMGALAPFSNAYHVYTKSFGLYSVTTHFDAESAFLGLPRNKGFCWEPGMFASMIVLALTFNVLRSGAKFYKGHNFWILVVGLITTFSTTGFISLAVLLLFKTAVGEASFGKKMAYTLILVLLVFLALDLPFMREKIIAQSSFDDFFTNSTNVYVGETGYRTVERFEGMYLSWLNLIDKPWLGYGPNPANSIVSQQFPMFIISNGNVNPLAMFGIILGIPLFVLLYKGTVKLSEQYRTSTIYLMFVIIMMISVSYNFMNDIIILSIAFVTFCKNSYNYE